MLTSLALFLNISGADIGDGLLDDAWLEGSVNVMRF
jgi:hypothetical protein